MNPHITFSRKQWEQSYQDSPLIFSQTKILEVFEKLKGQGFSVALDEITRIYLPLLRMLNIYIKSPVKSKRPLIIAITGSVAVGKSASSAVLQELLPGLLPHNPQVDRVSTDSFLYPKLVLQERGLLNKRGFPESYDFSLLLGFLESAKASKAPLEIPIFCHYYKDILSNKKQRINKPDIIILEGVNIAQIHANQADNYFDFSIYLDAPLDLLQKWYIQRFMGLCKEAKNNPTADLYRFACLSKFKAKKIAKSIWVNINQVNLLDNILPYREKAQLILCKGKGHRIEKILLRTV